MKQMMAMASRLRSCYRYAAKDNASFLMGIEQTALTSAGKLIGQQVDRMALYAINWRIPRNGASRFHCPVTLQDVVAQTRIVDTESPHGQLTDSGEHLIKLASRKGMITCRVKVEAAEKPDAPLFIYHHGLAEYPYTSTWRRLIPQDGSFPAHSVAIQAPYHTNLSDPIRIGFSSTEHLYQMLAGSLQIMHLVQTQFAQQGASYTVVGGLSWGGITSLLYEGIFNMTRAVVPLFSSPKLSQAIWDASQLLGRDLPISRTELDRLLDFTPIIDGIDSTRIFPILGEHDLFFRLENHANVYAPESLVTMPMTHIGAMWLRNDTLRNHVLQALAWAGENPR